MSIDPVLAIPGIRSALEEKPVLGVSPLIGGKTVKGPAAKMYQEMGVQPSAMAVAAHYGNLLDGFVIDTVDRDHSQELASAEGSPVEVFCTDIWMRLLV